MTALKAPPCPFTPEELRAWAEYSQPICGKTNEQLDTIAGEMDIDFSDLLALWLADALEKIKELEAKEAQMNSYLKRFPFFSAWAEEDAALTTPSDGEGPRND